jgi:hypothetical protein
MALAIARNAPINEMRSPGLGFPLLLLWKNGRYFSKKLTPKFQHCSGIFEADIRQLPWPCVNQNGRIVHIFIIPKFIVASSNCDNVSVSSVAACPSAIAASQLHSGPHNLQSC